MVWVLFVILLFVFFRIFRLAFASIVISILGFGFILGSSSVDGKYSTILTIVGVVLVGASFYFRGEVKEKELKKGQK